MIRKRDAPRLAQLDRAGLLTSLRRELVHLVQSQKRYTSAGKVRRRAAADKIDGHAVAELLLKHSQVISVVWLVSLERLGAFYQRQPPAFAEGSCQMRRRHHPQRRRRVLIQTIGHPREDERCLGRLSRPDKRQSTDLVVGEALERLAYVWRLAGSVWTVEVGSAADGQIGLGPLHHTLLRRRRGPARYLFA